MDQYADHLTRPRTGPHRKPIANRPPLTVTTRWRIIASTVDQMTRYHNTAPEQRKAALIIAAHACAIAQELRSALDDLDLPGGTGPDRATTSQDGPGAARPSRIGLR